MEKLDMNETKIPTLELSEFAPKSCGISEIFPNTNSIFWKFVI